MEGVSEGGDVGVKDGVVEGSLLGLLDIVGIIDGKDEGPIEGSELGKCDGVLVGVCDGEVDGKALGLLVGIALGLLEILGVSDG